MTIHTVIYGNVMRCSFLVTHTLLLWYIITLSVQKIFKKKDFLNKNWNGMLIGNCLRVITCMKQVQLKI